MRSTSRVLFGPLPIFSLLLPAMLVFFFSVSAVCARVSSASVLRLFVRDASAQLGNCTHTGSIQTTAFSSFFAFASLGCARKDKAVFAVSRGSYFLPRFTAGATATLSMLVSRSALCCWGRVSREKTKEWRSHLSFGSATSLPFKPVMTLLSSHHPLPRYCCCSFGNWNAAQWYDFSCSLSASLVIVRCFFGVSLLEVVDLPFSYMTNCGFSFFFFAWRVYFYPPIPGYV